MFDLVAGLPLHPLIVHATEVVVPAAALAVILAALWRRFRQWAYALPLALSLAALVLTPITTQSGEALARRVEASALLGTHMSMAEGLLPFVAVLTIAAAGLFWWARQERTNARLAAAPGPTVAPTGLAALPRPLIRGLVVLAVLAGIGTTVQAVRIGHSGAEAAWSDVVTPAGSESPSPGDG
ncbi:DUF2231 domain-containing protein [Actinotalea sp.]|uniref:DUF2231 domain-containing protein n=1 Tax=Actinotalea sp. TaxID=1872145 RepID=UPI003566DB61